MPGARAEAVARCLEELARLEPAEELAALVTLVRLWLERDRLARARGPGAPRPG